MHSKGFTLSKFSANMGPPPLALSLLLPWVDSMSSHRLHLALRGSERGETVTRADDQMALGVAVFIGLGSSFPLFQPRVPRSSSQ